MCPCQLSKKFIAKLITLVKKKYVSFWERARQQWKRAMPEQESRWFLAWRSVLHFLQRRAWGFDNSDTWSLRDTHARWIIPRLKRFKRLHINYPSDGITPEEWEVKLQSMIDAFELVLLADEKMRYSKQEERTINKGLNNFKKYYFDLWW